MTVKRSYVNRGVKMVNKNRIFRKAAGLYALANIAAFILFFLFTGVEGVADTAFGVNAYFYVISPIMKGVDILIPVSAAFIIYLAYLNNGNKAAIGYGALIASGRYVYTFVYYYLYFVYDGYSSVEAVELSGLWSILGYAIHYAIILAIFFSLKFAIHRMCPTGDRVTIISSTATLDFKCPICLASIISSAVAFVYLFVLDLIDVISFLIEYGLDVTPSELATMLIAFIADVAFLFIIHSVNMAIKNRIANKLWS